MMSFELINHLIGLHLDDFKWLKPEILTEAKKFSNDDHNHFDDFVED